MRKTMILGTDVSEDGDFGNVGKRDWGTVLGKKGLG